MDGVSYTWFKAFGGASPRAENLSPDTVVRLSGRRGCEGIRGGRCYDPIGIIAYQSVTIHSHPTTKTPGPARESWLSGEPTARTRSLPCKPQDAKEVHQGKESLP